MSEKNVKIRFGNSWLLADDHQTEIQWINDRMVASAHTLEWAERFRDENMLQRKHVELFTVDEVAQMAVKSRSHLLLTAWLDKFSNQVQKTYEPTFSNEGLWCNAHMLHGMGLSVEEAVVKIGDKDHLRLKKMAQEAR